MRHIGRRRTDYHNRQSDNRNYVEYQTGSSFVRGNSFNGRAPNYRRRSDPSFHGDGGAFYGASARGSGRSYVAGRGHSYGGARGGGRHFGGGNSFVGVRRGYQAPRGGVPTKNFKNFMNLENTVFHRGNSSYRGGPGGGRAMRSRNVFRGNNGAINRNASSAEQRFEEKRQNFTPHNLLIIGDSMCRGFKHEILLQNYDSLKEQLKVFEKCTPGSRNVDNIGDLRKQIRKDTPYGKKYVTDVKIIWVSGTNCIYSKQNDALKSKDQVAIEATKTFDDIVMFIKTYTEHTPTIYVLNIFPRAGAIYRRAKDSNLICEYNDTFEKLLIECSDDDVKKRLQFVRFAEFDCARCHMANPNYMGLVHFKEDGIKEVVSKLLPILFEKEEPAG